jgi:hypothetical protein
MISTVTTTTVTTVTTATVTVLAGLAFFAVLTLLGVLITKEVASVGQEPRLRSLSRGLNVAMVPLLIAFVVIAAIQVLQALL